MFRYSLTEGRTSQGVVFQGLQAHPPSCFSLLPVCDWDVSSGSLLLLPCPSDVMLLYGCSCLNNGPIFSSFRLAWERTSKKTVMKLPGKPNVVAPGNLKRRTLEASLPEWDPDSKRKKKKEERKKEEKWKGEKRDPVYRCCHCCGA